MPARTHGLSKTRTWWIWWGMLRRCYQVTNTSYSRYGGRGIKVSEAWRNDFAAFLSDMGHAPEGSTLDRIDNDGNYEPGNCRWATVVEQNRNTSANRRFEYAGHAMTQREWEIELGLSCGALWHRLKSGWTVEQALRTPKGGAR